MNPVTISNSQKDEFKWTDWLWAVLVCVLFLLPGLTYGKATHVDDFVNAFPIAAFTAFLLTAMSLLVTFIALFSLLVTSVIDSFHENTSYDRDHGRVFG